jgi:hypothetical protein
MKSRANYCLEQGAHARKRTKPREINWPKKTNKNKTSGGHYNHFTHPRTRKLDLGRNTRRTQHRNFLGNRNEASKIG